MTSTSRSRPEHALRTLLLYAQYGTRASYYDDWLDGFRASPQFDLAELNICQRDAAAQLRRGIREVDLVVLLHSVNADHVFYLEPLAGILAERRCRLLSFVGNEVNLPGAPIADKRRVLAALRPDWIATQLLAEAGEYLWADIAPVLCVPHALNPQAFRVDMPAAARPLDIGVRSFRYPAVLGDGERNRLIDWFVQNASARDLRTDIGSERLNRADWAKFLNRCRGTLATEAGSWYLQRDDALVRDVSAHYAKGGLLTLSSNHVALRRLAHRLPWRVRELLLRWLSRGPLRYQATALSDVPEQEILERFFAQAPRAPVYGKCISSRHFDAIGTGTVQILLAGRYNDLLVADRHYLSLAPDYSNLEEVLRRFRDEGERGRIAQLAREHVLQHHTYAHRIAALAPRLGA
jgi:hypothetical protein